MSRSTLRSPDQSQEGSRQGRRPSSASIPSTVEYELTIREREVLELLAAGRSDGEIADALFISKKTASVHVASIKGKLGASSRVEMAMLAIGISPIDDAQAATLDA